MITSFIGKSNQMVYVSKVYGMSRNGLEINLLSDAGSFDIFAIYRHNSTDQWCANHQANTMYKQYYPRLDKLCSAELLGFKFLVPCDPIETLTKEYGHKSNWMLQQSQAQKVKFNNLNLNAFDTWNDTDYAHAIKFYLKSGQMDVERTLKQINSFVKKKIYKLPFDATDPF